MQLQSWSDQHISTYRVLMCQGLNLRGGPGARLAANTDDAHTHLVILAIA